MKILHYISGLPPVRTGGMIKYATDLAEAQNTHDNVVLLVPGSIAIKREKRHDIKIRHTGKWHGISTFRIKNPLPIPMCNGILDIDEFSLSCNGEAYSRFLRKIRPDVIHIHTFMGLHREFLREAKALKIPVVFTSHDYFGLCPTVNLFYKDRVCQSPYTECAECSRHAYSERQLVIEQSVLYGLFRKSRLMNRLLQKHTLKKMKSATANAAINTICDSEERDYKALQRYYAEMFRDITYFHFNSCISRQVYERNLGPLPGETIYIGNSTIKDHRRNRRANGKLKIGFLGGDSAFKGLSLLQDAVNEIYTKGMDQIELQVYGSLSRIPYPFCSYYEPFSDAQRDAVFERMDILAVPSRWMETFCMAVPEALSYGVPVIVSDKVGAKGLLEQNGKACGIVLPDTLEAWKSCIENLYRHRETIQILNRNITEASLELDYASHVRRIRHLYEILPHTP